MTTFTSTLTGSRLGKLGFALPLATWIRVAKERRMLGKLTEQQLRDIGVDAGAAAAEADRPFWDLPKGR